MKLDKKTGSRNSDGNVPNVNFDPDDRVVCVCCCDPDHSGDDLRSRSAVSCQPKPEGA